MPSAEKSWWGDGKIFGRGNTHHHQLAFHNQEKFAQFNIYLCMILSVRCMLCAEDWDGYIVFSQDRTDNPAFLNIPLIER